MPRRRRPSGIIALIVAAVLQMMAALPVAAAEPAPKSMAATGDSITRAYNTCFFPFTDCVANSWSTGTSTTVNSHARRLGITRTAYNDAVSGAKMIDLGSQMAKVGSHGKVIDYVTVLMGANDVCTDTVTAMTDSTTFEAQLRQGLDKLAASANGKKAVTYVVSVPNVYRLWEVLRSNSTAVSRWNSYGICQSLLANATSLAPADEARRRLVRSRNLELAKILNRVCAEYRKNVLLNCYPDNFAGFRYDFVPTDVSTRDYFHPSISGQKTIADVTFAVGPYGTQPPSTAPVAHFTLSCSGLTCSVDAAPSTDPNLPNDTLTYAWNFGDATRTTGVTASHTYAASGTYTIWLTVTDGSTQTDIDAGTVTLAGSG